MKTWKAPCLFVAFLALNPQARAEQIAISHKGKFVTIGQKSQGYSSKSYSIRKSIIQSVTIEKEAGGSLVLKITTSELVPAADTRGQSLPAVSKTYRLYPHSLAYAEVLRDEILQWP